MPGLSRLFLRLSLLHLMVGLTLGALLLTGKGLPAWGGRLWGLLPPHVSALLWGWTTQFVMGVAYWILPRVGGARPRSALAWAALVLLNAGLGGMYLAYLFATPRWLLLLIRATPLGACLAFAVHAWPRVRPTYP